MNTEWKRLRNLMYSDLVLINAKKGQGVVGLVTPLVIIMLLMFFVSPLAVVYAPLICAIFTPIVLFSLEEKYHGGRLPCVLPIERKDRVKGRYLLVLFITLLSNAIIYSVGLLSLRLELYLSVLGDDEDYDIIKMMIEVANLNLTPVGVYHIAFFTSLALGLGFSAFSLRTYLLKKSSFGISLDKKSMKREMKFVVILATVFLVGYFLVVLELLPLREMASILMALIIQLMQVGNGFLLNIVTMTGAGCFYLYQYICALVDYEKIEL